MQIYIYIMNTRLSDSAGTRACQNIASSQWSRCVVHKYTSEFLLAVNDVRIPPSVDRCRSMENAQGRERWLVKNLADIATEWRLIWDERADNSLGAAAARRDLRIKPAAGSLKLFRRIDHPATRFYWVSWPNDVWTCTFHYGASHDGREDLYEDAGRFSRSHRI